MKPPGQHLPFTDSIGTMRVILLLFTCTFSITYLATD